MTNNFIEPLLLSLQLASITTIILIVIGTPIAWWLSKPGRWIKSFIEAIITLPLILPPTVLGFYLLITLNPNGLIGQLWKNITGSTLVFSFTGLVISSVIFSFPFVIQPLQTAFEQFNRQALAVASSLGAKPIDRFFSILIPLTKRGFFSSVILGFCHTLGEFGVVLMVGGNIPGKTQVVSIAIFDKVEQLQYDIAKQYSLILLIFSFIVLLSLSLINRKFTQYQTTHTQRK